MSTSLATVFLLLICCTQPFCCFEVDDRDFENLLARLKTLKQKADDRELLLKSKQKTIDCLAAEVEELAQEADSKDLTVKAADRRFVLDTYGPIAFSSVVTPFVLEHMHDNDGVVFDKVLTNFGGSYLNDSGIFTVPIAGIYLFTSSMLDSMQKGHHGDVLVHGELVRNNHTLVRVYARAETGYRDQGANTVLVDANVGDQFWVRVADNNDLGLGGHLYTSFSGVLLW